MSVHEVAEKGNRRVEINDSPFTLLLACREEHIQRKMDAAIVDAKAKMNKGDKKGKKRIETREKEDIIEINLPVDAVVWSTERLSPRCAVDSRFIFPHCELSVSLPFV